MINCVFLFFFFLLFSSFLQQSSMAASRQPAVAPAAQPAAEEQGKDHSPAGVFKEPRISRQSNPAKVQIAVKCAML